MFAHLVTPSETWGPRGGVADEELLLRHLRRLGLRETTPSMINPPADALNVDGVVRGPVEALDLSGDLAEAEARLATADDSAIELFDRIAQKLAANHFHPHATVMLRKRATALQRVGRVDEAVLAWAGIAWSELDFVRPWEAGFAMADGDTGGELTALNPQTHRVSKTAAAAISVAKGASLDAFIDAFDIMHEDDRHSRGGYHRAHPWVSLRHSSGRQRLTSIVSVDTSAVHCGVGVSVRYAVRVDRPWRR